MIKRHNALKSAFFLLALLAGLAGAQQPGGVVASTAADGSSVLLRWSLPDNRFPSGGFIVTRTSSASSTARHVPAPMPREEALALGLVDEAGYDFVNSVFGDEGDSDLIRALGAMSALVRPGLARVAGTIFEDTAVRSGTAYTYRVQTVSGSLVGEATVTAGTLWDPLPVTGVRAVPAAGGVDLSWNTPADDALLVTFNIYRTAGGTETRINPDPVFMPVAGDGPVSFYTDADVAVGQTYSYRVEGVDLFGRSSPLSAPAVLVVPDPDAIASPEPLDTESGQLSITVSWPAVTDERISALGVRRAASPGGEGLLVTPELLPATATAFTDEGVEGGTSYYYSLVAYDEAGRIAPESSRLEGRGINRIPPAAPTGLEVTAADDGLSLRWDPSPESDVAVYRVYVSRTGQPARDADFSYLGATADTSFTLDVEAGTLSSFSLRVTALNSSDVEGTPSQAVASRIVDTVAPDAPRLRDAREAGEGVLVTWQFALDPDIASLNLYRSTGGGAPVLLKEGLDQADREVLDTDVVPGVAYAYSMTASDRSGNESDRSGALVVTLRPEAPADPDVAGLSARVTDAGVQVSWEAREGASWFVQRSRAGQDRWVQVAGPVAGSSYLDDRGEAGDSYRVQPLGEDGRTFDPSPGVTAAED